MIYKNKKTAFPIEIRPTLLSDNILNTNFIALYCITADGQKGELNSLFILPC